MTTLPIIMGPEGPIPTPPATLRQQLIDLVTSTNPGYTATLPASLIEDISSTDVGGIIISNQFMIDLINSISPYAANSFILNQLGVDVYGIQPTAATNTSVDVVFLGTPGFIIIPGFTVTDANYQYVSTEGGVVGSNGQSLPIHCVATQPGTWAVPSGSVNQLVTSVPSNIQLTCVNPVDGIPSTSTESETSFRTRTLTAGLASSTGMDRYLKTLLWNIPGVQQRLVSVRQDTTNSKYIIIVGGGDPYQVAWAIYYALFDLSALEAPMIPIAWVSNTNPVMITTATNHNLSDGMLETINGVHGTTILNGNQYYVNITGPNTFNLYTGFTPGTIVPPVPPVFSGPVDGTNTAVYLPYTHGGTVSPNPILQEIFLNSYPDTYLVPFILPAQQYVNIVCTWNTDNPNYVSPQAVAQAAGPVLVEYINSLYVGVSPINIYDMTTLFVNSVANILPSENITVLNFVVSFDGSSYYPVPGTGVIYGDPNSYFYTDISQIEVVQVGQQ
jgi:hypothetical protein